MKITVNAAVLCAVLSQQPQAELAGFLNAAIDEELAKGDEMDVQLIDECVNALCELETGAVAGAYAAAAGSKNIVRYCHRHAFGKRIVLQRTAIAVLVLALGSVIAYSASPAVAGEAKNIYELIHSYLFENILASFDENEEPVKALYGRTKNGTDLGDLYLRVKSAEDIDLNELEIIAVTDTKGTEEHILLSACSVEKEEFSDANGHFVTVVVGYRGCAFTVLYEIEE